MGQNYAMILSAKNADRNIALSILGGCIEGLAIKTSVVTTDNYKVKRDEGIVAIHNESFTEMTFILPDMNWYDEGHQITLCVSAMYKGYYSFYIKPGYCYDKKGTKKETFIHWHGNNYTISGFNNASRIMGYDSITFIYVPRWNLVNGSAVMQSGMWIVSAGTAQ